MACQRAGSLKEKLEHILEAERRGPGEAKTEDALY